MGRADAAELRASGRVSGTPTENYLSNQAKPNRTKPLQTLLSYGHQIALHTENYDKAERMLETALLVQPFNTDSQQVREGEERERE